MKEILKLDHIQKYYGNGGNVTKAIQDISFSVRDGAIFTEIRKGGDSRRTFFEKILDVLTMMGGGTSDVR